MNRINWVQVAVFGLVALLVFALGAALLSSGWGWGPGGMMGPGMMGGWSFGPLGWLFMLLGFLFPLGLLALLILGIVWLVRQVSAPSGPITGPPSPPAGPRCSNCDRAVQADWRLCPYCGQELA